MIISSLQNVVFSHFISGKAVTSKCYAKYVSWKVFKNSLKRWRSTFPIMLQPLLLAGCSQGTWRKFKQHLSTQKTVEEHSIALKRHSKGIRIRLEGNVGSQRKLKGTLKGTRKSPKGHTKVTKRTLEHSKHLNTWVLEALKALYLADSLVFS